MQLIVLRIMLVSVVNLHAAVVWQADDRTANEQRLKHIFQPIWLKQMSCSSKILEDTFGRKHTYLRISLTERCNLRCKYCMPEEGINLSPKSHLLTTDEVIKLAGLFVQQGVTKIRLTGGEPTVRKDLPIIIERLRRLENLKTIGLTTNGLTLMRQLSDLQKAGLDKLNISLDTMKEDKFQHITRRKGLSRVLEGIKYALSIGFDPVKINCVVMKNLNDDEVLDFVEMTKEMNVDVRFIEYMPFGGNQWHDSKFVPYTHLLNTIRERYPDVAQLTSQFNQTSKPFKVPGYLGQIGFITSISEHFCGSCNRIRLLADGSLKVCLLGSAEVSLRDALRVGCSDDDISLLIKTAISRKKSQHADEWRMNNADIKNISAQPSAGELIYLPSYLPFSDGQQLEINCGKSDQSSTKEKFGYTYINSLRNSLKTYRDLTLLSIGEIHGLSNKIGKRFMCSAVTDPQLSHVTSDGKAQMVDVTNKSVSERCASAYAEIHVGDVVAKLIRENSMAKGDVLTVAKLAGIMAAKNTSSIIPLCHNIALSYVDVQLTLDDQAILVQSVAKCQNGTGVEMEAMVAACATALTVYDMCKAVSHDIIIKEVKLLQKSGGKRDFKRENNRV